LIRRLLIVGSGSAGQRHLRIARRFLPKAQIRVLKYSKQSKSLSLATGYYFHPDEAAHFDPQAAIVANPAPFHLETSIKLASHGCHLLLEKPIAERSKGVEHLLRMVKKQKVILQVGYNLRFSHSLRSYRKLIKKGAIGRILSIHAEVGQFLPSWRPKINYQHTVSAKAKLGGGVLLELSHEIDYLRWIFGEVAWVSAWKGKVGDLNLDVEDSAKLQMGFASKSRYSGVIASLNMDFVRQDPVRFCEATGTRGTLRWDGIRKKIERYIPKSRKWIKIPIRKERREESYAEQFKNFLQCARKNHKPNVSGTDGLAVLKIVDAAKRSHEKKGLRIPVMSKNN